MKAQKLTLSKRLQMCADFVQCGAVLLDVGTDHGYLPAHLLLEQKIKYAVASDIGKGPLKNAESTFQKYDLQDKTRLVLSNGFDSIDLSDITDVVMAGMGGTLMARLLKAVEAIPSDIYFVLQPMSRAEDTRRFLFENEFIILDENVIFEDGRRYLSIHAKKTEEKVKYTTLDIYAGTLLENTDRVAFDFLKNEKLRHKIRYNALLSAKQGKEEQAILREVLDGLKDIE